MNKNIPLYTAEQLVHLQRNIPTLFSIQLSEQQEFLECSQIFRLLPQRRLVCLAKHKKSPVLVKLFIHPHKAKNDYQKEVHGYEQLEQTDLLIPKRLEHGSLNQDGFYILYEYLSNSQSFSSVLERTNYSDSLISQMLTCICKMHNADLQQLDLHLDNFLCYQDKLYSIDFGDVVVLKNRQEQVKNLADILSQLPIVQDKNLPHYLQSYNQNLSDQQRVSQVLIEKEIKQWRAWRIKKYLQKSARDCSEFVKFQTFKEFKILRRTYSEKKWDAFFNQLDKLIESAPRLKDGNTATVSLVPFNNQQLVVKRYNIKNLKHLLSRFWRPSRAWISWQNAQRLKVLGIVTPKPIAIIEKRWGWLRFQAYYISEYDDSKDALAYYAQHKNFTPQHLNAFKELFDGLKRAQISHGDLKGNNLLLSTKGISIIDLDAMKEHKNIQSFNKAHQKDRSRFFKNWQNDEQLLAKFKAIISP